MSGRTVFGDYLRNVFEDIDKADLILVWGDNPAADSPSLNLLRIRAAQKKGVRVIVIDHHRSETALATRAEGIAQRSSALVGVLSRSFEQLLIR